MGWRKTADKTVTRHPRRRIKYCRLFGGSLMGAADGKRAVIGEAFGAAGAALATDREAAAGEQLSMLAIPGERASRGAAKLREIAARRNQAGRPPGSINKSNKELREYLLLRGVHPLQRMMEWLLHTPQSLAAELGCTPLEAFRELRSLM